MALKFRQPVIPAVPAREPALRLASFRVRNYRNVIDSGPIDVSQITALVGQNESGKSNLCEALFRLNPFDGRSTYNIKEDWPVDRWGSRDPANVVCEATFLIEDAGQIAEFLAKTAAEPVPQAEQAAGESAAASAAEEARRPKPQSPKSIAITVGKRYDGTWITVPPGDIPVALDLAKLEAWAKERLPKCVYVYEYSMPGAQTELSQLAAKHQQHGWNGLTPQEQAILIVLELANIDINDFISKGGSADGRTERSFDRRQASGFLTSQFAKLWGQKAVKFEIDVDADTLNIFVEDEGFGMPVRLDRRSTGFRWYVSFAWLFTRATRGEYKGCILLLEEPGIHLHHAGHGDLLKLFEQLSQSNVIIYTTHVATMLDTAFPERVRIVEVRDHHSSVVNGMVSGQKHPMMVIEASLGLAGNMSGLLGTRQTLIVEGADDAIILQKLSGVLLRSGKTGLSDRVYLFPADGAAKTPMYAGFLIGHEWDAGVLLDSDTEGEAAREKIRKLYPTALTAGSRFRVFMLGKAAGISKTDAAIEDIFPEDFYLECVNAAYGVAIDMSELPVDGSTLISKRVEHVLRTKHARSELDKGLVMREMLRRFDAWSNASVLPAGTADRAEKLFKAINDAFGN